MARTSITAVLVFTAVTLGSISASASPEYPDEIKAHLNTPITYECTLCHQDLGGGKGTVIQLFGVTMMSRGLRGGGSTSLLDTTLDAVDGEKIDSDGDGVADIDELRAGTDPNDDGKGTAGTKAVTPIYGCVGQVVPTDTSAVSWASLLAVAGLVAFRRKK